MTTLSDAVAERDRALAALERRKTMPIVAVVMGGLVERGWSINPDGYVDPDGQGYPSVAEALVAQTLREVGDRFNDDGSDIDMHPSADDPNQQLVHRTMDAITRAVEDELAEEPLMPNVTIIASVPPHGRIGVASSEPDVVTVLHAINLAMGAVQRTVRLRAGRQ